jgi:hypothetical protein
MSETYAQIYSRTATPTHLIPNDGSLWRTSIPVALQAQQKFEGYMLVGSQNASITTLYKI